MSSAIIQLLSVVTLETDFIPCVFITALHNEHPRERQTVSGDCGDQRESSAASVQSAGSQ